MIKKIDYIKKISFVSIFVFGVLFMPFALTFATHDKNLACNTDDQCIASTLGWKNARCSGGVKDATTSLGHCVEAPPGSQQLPEGPKKAGDILDTLDTVTDWVFAVAMTIALIFLIMAAFQFVTGGGDAAKVTEARQKLMYAFIGIAVAFVSAGFVRVIAELVK